MTPFKDIIDEDIADVFLNASEFAEHHAINGIAVMCIIDDDVSEDNVNISIYGDAARGNSGLYNNARIIYVSATALPGKPKVNGVLDVDGKRYLVQAVDDEDGMYKITIEYTGGR